MKAATSSEERYVKKRIRRARLERIAYCLCHIFPIQQNKVVLWTLEGKGGFACSPKYIAQELLRRNREGTNWTLYWLNGGNKNFPQEIKPVKDSLWSRAYHLSTARFWVGNTRTFLGTAKRKGTSYIMVWHGSIALKPIGLYRGNKFSKIARLVSEADSKLIDVALSGSRWCSQTWRDGLIYDGKIVEAGTPRCDILFNGVEKCHTELRERYGLPQDARICLYAPTFRGGSQGTKRSVNTEPISLDLQGLLCTLEKRFGGSWYLFLRLHPQLAASLEKMPLPEEQLAADKNSGSRLIDVSQLPDMAEIMAATDCIVTDYSTIIFEGFLTGQPGFIYADDFDEYVADRGKLMFSAEEIPFPVARTNSELFQNIQDFDEAAYRSRCETFRRKTGIIDDGNASRRAVDVMEKIAKREKI